MTKAAALGPADTMLASRLHGIRDLRLERLPRPVPGPGEVLLRIEAVGVCGSDVHYYSEGRIGPAVIASPIIMGHEFSATVTELGAGVHGMEVGSRVAVEPAISCGRCEWCLRGDPNLCPGVRFCGTPPTHGVLAEFAVMPADNCFLLPSGLTAIEGALLEPLGIAIHVVDLAHIRVGQSVAVVGAGPIGLLTAVVARASGAGPVYITEPLEYRREFASRYTNGMLLDPRDGDAGAEIRRLTGGRGVDVAFEAAGSADAPQQAAEAACPGGTLVLVGIPSDDLLSLNASTIRRKGLTIRVVRRMKHTYPRAIRLVQSGLVEVASLATHAFTLEETADAFQLVAGYLDRVIKAMVVIDGK